MLQWSPDRRGAEEPGMDIKLKIFCAVAETKSFSKASRIVHLSQPAVSLQIQALEEFFGTKLFDRSKSLITLTQAGEILYPHAKHVLEHYADINKEIGKITGLIKGGVTVGASTTLGNHVMPRVIIDFKKEHPKTRISMLVGNTKRIENLVASGLVDFGVVAGDVSKSSVKTEPLISDELVLIVPPQHLWAKSKSLSIMDITREPFILREEGSGTRQKIEEVIARYGIGVRDLRVALVLGSTESIKEAVEAGIGVSFVSKWAIKKEVEDGRLKIAPLKEGPVLRNLSLITIPHKGGFSLIIEEFLLFVRKYPYIAFFPGRS